jgi:hypothetical protein
MAIRNEDGTFTLNKDMSGGQFLEYLFNPFAKNYTKEETGDLTLNELNSMLEGERQADAVILEYEKSGVVPAGWNEEAYGDFGTYAAERNKKKQQGTLNFSEGVLPFLNEDQLNKFYPDMFKEALKQEGNEDFKRINLGDLKNTAQRGEDGKVVYNPSVTTMVPNEDGTFAIRENDITMDGRNQRDGGEPMGAFTVRGSDLDVIYDAKKAKLLQTAPAGTEQGIRMMNQITSRNLSMDDVLNSYNQINSPTTPRETVLNIVSGLSDSIEGNKEATEGEAKQEQPTSPQTSGENLIDVGSYDATDEQIRELTAGYTRKGQGQSGRTSTISAKQTGLTNALISDRDIIKKLSGKQLNKREKESLRNAQNRFDAGVTEARNFDIRTTLRTNLESLQGDNKTKYGTLLAKTNFDLIAKNPALREELRTTSPEEFLQKYTKEDGSLDKEKLYGNVIPPEAKKALNNSITKEQVDQFAKLVEANDIEGITKLVNSIDISEEDNKVLTDALVKAGGDFRKMTQKNADIDIVRQYVLSSLATLPKNAPIAPYLTNISIGTFIETGLLNTQGTTIANQVATNRRLAREEARQALDYSDPYEKELDELNAVKRKARTDEDSSLVNYENYFNTISPLINSLKTKISTKADREDYAQQLIEVMKRYSAEQDPGFWREVFSLGFAQGGRANLFGNEIDVRANKNKEGKITGITVGDLVYTIRDLRKQGFSDTFISILVAAGDS